MRTACAPSTQHSHPRAAALPGAAVANDANDLHVAVGSELDLENRVLGRIGYALPQPVVVGNRDREARLRRICSVESPQR